jgi:hypothetical protein
MGGAHDFSANGGKLHPYLSVATYLSVPRALHHYVFLILLSDTLPSMKISFAAWQDKGKYKYSK